MNPSPQTVLEFGDFELDPQRLELRRGGRRVGLRPQPARLLVLLVTHAGSTVSREQIRQDVWGDDSVVEFDQGVNSCVKQIRSALGDSADHPRFVRTVPRRGYEFLADVHERPAPTPTNPPRSKVPVGLGLGVLAAVVMLAALLWWGETDPPTVHVPPDGRLMLAVLPFENLSGDPDREYFSDGLTEEMIFQLSRLDPDRLGIIARTSVMPYKSGEKTVAEIGSELGVDYVLEGSVRQDRGRVRVTAQLIAVADQSHLWADTYEDTADDLFGLQGGISSRVAQSLTGELLFPGQHPPLQRLPVSQAAYDLYLQARHQWNRFDREGLQHARSKLEEAVRVDPSFALAWASLADCYNLLPFQGDLTPSQAYPLAKQAARKALELAPDLAMAHNALGFALFYFDWAWDDADTAFRRAVELEPGYAMAHHWYAGLLSARGDHDQAIAEVKRAVDLDPRSLSVRSDLVWYYLFARRYDEAIQEAQRALEQDPYHGWARYGLAMAYVKTGKWELARDQALVQLEQAEAPDVEVARMTELPPQEALEELWGKRLEEALGGDPPSTGYSMAVRYAMLGHVQPAITELRAALAGKDAWIVFLNVDPRLDSLREAKAFQGLVRSLGLGPPF